MMKGIVFTVCTVGWMAVIFFFSNQKATVSTNLSDGFIDKTIIKIYEVFKGDVHAQEKQIIQKYFSRPIRKLAHFTVYFILGVLVFYTLKTYGMKTSLPYFSILICILYAMSDEIHQLFVIGRSGEFWDVVLDSLASSVAIIIFNRKSNKI